MLASMLVELSDEIYVVVDSGIATVCFKHNSATVGGLRMPAQQAEVLVALLSAHLRDAEERAHPSVPPIYDQDGDSLDLAVAEARRGVSVMAE